MVELDLKVHGSGNRIRREKIEQAWEHVVKGGFKYMERHGSQ